MTKKKTNIMADDAIYVIYVTAISVGLLFLGASLSFQG